MKLTNFHTMDAHLLLGLVNTELRNHCTDFEDLVKTHDLNPEELSGKLAGAGYEYQPDQNQFR
jgi:hypothetical protein